MGRGNRVKALGTAVLPAAGRALRGAVRGPRSCQSSRQRPGGADPSRAARALGGGGAEKPAPSLSATGRTHCETLGEGGVGVTTQIGGLGCGAPLLRLVRRRERSTWEAMLLRKEQAAMAAPLGGRSQAPLPPTSPFRPPRGGLSRTMFTNRVGGGVRAHWSPLSRRRCAEAEGCPTAQGKGESGGRGASGGNGSRARREPGGVPESARAPPPGAAPSPCGSVVSGLTVTARAWAAKGAT